MTVGSRGCYLWVFYILTNMLTGSGSQNMFFAHNFLNIQWIFNPKKVLES